MVQSRIFHPTLQLIDITEQFHDTAARLPPGQLIKDEHLTLFEAVGALEIGDPKMDSGCLEDGEDLEDDFDFSQPLSEEQSVWLMDELVCREVAWHRGYPLSQTLFTSVHIDSMLWPEPKQLSEADFIKAPRVDAPPLLHQVFRAYCLGLIKCCHLVHHLVTNQHYYEEEDFATQLFNRELLHTFSPEDILDLMGRAEEDLRAASGTSEVKVALLDRLGFRINLLNILVCCLDAIEPEQNKIDDYLQLVSRMESMDSGHARVVDQAFSTKIQRRLASSVPPRPMIVVDRKESFDFLRQLGADIGAAFQMFVIGHGCDLHAAYWLFNAKKPEPSVYVRALLQSFLSINQRVLGTISPEDLMTEDLKMLTLPASILLDPRHVHVENPVDPRFRIHTQMNQFIHKVAPLMVNHCRSLCQNRCRMRRMICHAVMELDAVQADAEDMDGFLQTLINESPISYPPGDAPTYAFSLSSWVYHYKLMQLQLVVQMGFEQSVYAHHEYAGMYWYLSNLASLYLSHLERISCFVSSNTHQRALGLNGEEQSQQLQNAMSLLYRHFSKTKAIDTLASALHRLYVVLQRHGHYCKGSPSYSSDQLRFELRMRPFQSLSIPEPLTYAEMEELSIMDGIPDNVVLEQASTLALTSRKAWQEILRQSWNFKPLQNASDRSLKHASIVAREYENDVRKCMKAAIGTSIAITTLSKAMGEKTNQKKSSSPLKDLKVTIPGPDEADRFHPWWAVPKITR